MEILITSTFFLLLGAILGVVLVFLYKMTMAVGRLDRRMQQLAEHLRDLNLYDLHPGGEQVLGEATELEGAVELGSDADLGEERATSTSKRRHRDRTPETDTTPLRPLTGKTGD